MSSPWFPPLSTARQSLVIAQSSPPEPIIAQNSRPDSEWMYSTLALSSLLVASLVYGKYKLDQSQKELKFEQYKNKDLKRKLKLVIHTIKKMENNPDLVHSRAFNLDYLRMRMDEEVFHDVIVNQIKTKINQLIGQALRPSTARDAVGIVQGARKIDETFDVTYEVETQEGLWNKGVLFRIQVKLTKLPAQTSSATVNEIINCVETFLSAHRDQDNWQPAIYGHLVLMSWDQRAKPTPLLVMEQSEEGVNVSFRSNPMRSPSLPRPLTE